MTTETTHDPLHLAPTPPNRATRLHVLRLQLRRMQDQIRELQITSGAIAESILAETIAEAERLSPGSR